MQPAIATPYYKSKTLAERAVWTFARENALELTVINPATPQAAGHRFIAAGPFLSVGELAEVLRQPCPEQARKLPTCNLPDWLVRLVANFDADLRSVVDDLGHGGRVSNARALEVLGWEPRDVTETIRDTTESLIRLGVV